MARRRFFLRATRTHKKPKPGRKKLVKFPKKLVYEQDQSWDEDAFYCWTFDRPTSPWLWVGSLLLVVVVFLMCLFPLAPYSVKVHTTAAQAHETPSPLPLPSSFLSNSLGLYSLRYSADVRGCLCCRLPPPLPAPLLPASLPASLSPSLSLCSTAFHSSGQLPFSAQQSDSTQVKQHCHMLQNLCSRCYHGQQPTNPNPSPGALCRSL